jgi:hypothetical protein
VRALYDSLLFTSTETAAAGFRLFPKTRTLYSVRLWGPLPALWADHFTRGLSARGLSILNGFARQDATGAWGAEFLITPTPGAADPHALDFLELTRQAPPEDGAPLLIDRFAVDGAPDRGGSLFLEVRGPDRVGFLGSLLRVLAGLGLVPREMTVVTRVDEACDRFLLTTPEGRLPTEDQRRALEAALEAHQRLQQTA